MPKQSRTTLLYMVQCATIHDTSVYTSNCFLYILLWATLEFEGLYIHTNMYTTHTCTQVLKTQTGCVMTTTECSGVPRTRWSASMLTFCFIAAEIVARQSHWFTTIVFHVQIVTIIILYMQYVMIIYCTASEH